MKTTKMFAKIMGVILAGMMVMALASCSKKEEKKDTISLSGNVYKNGEITITFTAKDKMTVSGEDYINGKFEWKLPLKKISEDDSEITFEYSDPVKKGMGREFSYEKENDEIKWSDNSSFKRVK